MCPDVSSLGMDTKDTSEARVKRRKWRAMSSVEEIIVLEPTWQMLEIALFPRCSPNLEKMSSLQFLENIEYELTWNIFVLLL